MDTDGTHGGERRTPFGTGHVPRPAGPPGLPGIQGLPPKPAHAPAPVTAVGAVPGPAGGTAGGQAGGAEGGAAGGRAGGPSAGPAVGPTLADWLRVPRPAAGPGVWSYGHVPRAAQEPEVTPTRQLVSGALISLLAGLLLWSLLWNGYLGGFWLWPLYMFTPDSWAGTLPSVVASYIWYAIVAATLAIGFGRLGRWPELARRILPGGRAARAEVPAPRPVEPGGPDDPAAWADVRAAGLVEVADRLGAEARAGRMNDVDHVRIGRAWETVRADPSRARAFADAVRDKGAGACVHPSGARDLPVRAARHDLLARQVLLGTVQDGERNPYARRGSGLALDPAVLGTSLLAIGPSGAGKTSRLVRPVVESLALQALAGQAAVVVVASAGTALGPDTGYDVVVRVGDPDSVYDLDLYGGATDPDEAAMLLAEGFVGDLPGIDVRRAATALAQLLGPFRAAYGRFPAVPELRELLDRVPVALAALREALEAAGQQRMLRELDARERQHGAPADPGPALADRVALLDRPAFAGFFNVAAIDTDGPGRPFSLRALEHPLRVRVDLPERGHADASRMLARLLLAQFNAAAAARTDRSLFALLAFDDASHTLTAEAVRGIQRLRSANAGVLLTLRTLDDVPEALRTPLLGAVGCRMAFSGVTTWDGKRFAETWGTEWVETRDVTHRTVFADQPLTRAIHAFRKLVSGKAVTTDAVTVRQVERERWSASDLAHVVPPGHAVLSLTSVRGERAAPLLVRLGGRD
ncbi:ATP-binding protein [Streptomyces sp. AP-93]|uniref:ATP-binding protein n=1 Tax=Streptomyces sp. AP-93 TaxID=2929048 RepID=UPI001FAF0A58|nr:ATP-binding protein [Streptomyces sp. AP-93]MCJ0872371.1 ATP-binding protein [Streptomyces sp. AP-93]